MILHWKQLVLVILALVFLFSIFGHYVFFFLCLAVCGISGRITEGLPLFQWGYSIYSFFYLY